MTKEPPRGNRPPSAAPPSSSLRSGGASPFAGLEALRGSLPSRPEATTGATTTAASGATTATATGAATTPPRPNGPARAVVRMERKGRGGREVTVVDKLGLRPAELETWCKALKQTLGCGGSVEGDMIMLQGDLRTRLPAVLAARGVAKVTVG
jgi:translation initiation factor 1